MTRRRVAAMLVAAVALLAVGAPSADAGGGWGSQVVGVTATEGRLWSVQADGLVRTHLDAPHLGDGAALPLNQPIVGMSATASGDGYWLIAADGGVFSFGDATFHGSTGDLVLNRPVVGMAPDPDGVGYWFVATDGGVFAYDAEFHGSTGDLVLNRPVNGITATPTGAGYWMVADDGGIFAFGDAGFHGSLGGVDLGWNVTVIGMQSTASGEGYWLFTSDGRVVPFGDAIEFSTPRGATLGATVVIRDDGTVAGLWQLDDAGLLWWAEGEPPLATAPPLTVPPVADALVPPARRHQPLPPRVGRSYFYFENAIDLEGAGPLRFDRCSPLLVHLDTSARPDWDDGVRDVLARIEEVSGYDVRIVDEAAGVVDADGWFRAGTPGIYVGIVARSHPMWSAFDDDVLGVGRMGPDSGSRFVRQAHVILAADHPTDGYRYLDRWGDDPDPRTAEGLNTLPMRDALAHELGHALGLDHVARGAGELMEREINDIGRPLGAGTRWALDALGRRFACDNRDWAPQ